jgi:uroporphyrin-III C-methyltransferase/precorrin-2 dehydrogenase/sirohydrochlorin ferrochelatase
VTLFPPPASAPFDLPPGGVALVGAGPGDPGLLTLHAVRALEAAEVVLYDRLVGPGVLALAHPDAVLVEVGKSAGRHSTAQEDIHALMLEHAGAGRRVVRLKGGDPFVFGRGGEELEVLRAHGIPYRVVPGITAAVACAAYAGIPLTHRDHASSVVFATGHSREGGEAPDWAALARPRQTVVIYMGLAGLPHICERLVAHGLPPDWPAAVVEQGTLLDQRVVTATLATLAQAVEAEALQSPCLTIVGEVVRLRDQLAWFEPKAGPAVPFIHSQEIPRSLHA